VFLLYALPSVDLATSVAGAACRSTTGFSGRWRGSASGAAGKFHARRPVSGTSRQDAFHLFVARRRQEGIALYHDGTSVKRRGRASVVVLTPRRLPSPASGDRGVRIDQRHNVARFSVVDRRWADVFGHHGTLGPALAVERGEAKADAAMRERTQRLGALMRRCQGAGRHVRKRYWSTPSAPSSTFRDKTMTPDRSARSGHRQRGDHSNAVVSANV
jgi:hypothetical protein